MTQKQRNERPSRIPEFASREEEAEWFDTHDMADYQDEFTTVNAHFEDNLSCVVVVDLGAESYAALHLLAERTGVGEAALVKQWVLERLGESKGQLPEAG